MVTEHDVPVADGRSVHVYDTGVRPGNAPTLLWHHGSPQTGAPLAPLVTAAEARDMRLISYGRPSYGGSTPYPGRDVASAAADVERIVDALGVDRFAVMGASGGGPPALACAALLPDRVVAAVLLAGIAPFTEAFDWFAGMVDDGGPRAALGGRAARAEYEESAVFDENVFIAADWAALGGGWSSLGEDAGAAGRTSPDGLVDDDVSFVTPWGFEVAQVTVPVLLVQGGADRVVPPAHAYSMLDDLPSGELWLRPRDGHVSVLDACPVAMDWLRAQV